MKKIILFLGAIAMLSAGMIAPLSVNAAEDVKEVVVPKLQIGIPGLSNSDFEGSVIIGKDNAEDDCPQDKVCIETINLYLNSVYRFSIGAGIIFAIIIIMIGGVEYMIGSSVGGVAKAKKHMAGATIGLILLLSTTTIISFINPNISALGGLRVTSIREAPKLGQEVDDGIPTYSDMIDNSGNIVKGVSPYEDADGQPVKSLVNNVGAGAAMVHKDIVARLQLVGSQMANPSKVQGTLLDSTADASNVLILGTFNDVRKTATDFYAQCILSSCKSNPICNPFEDNTIVEGSLVDGYKLTTSAKNSMKDMDIAEKRSFLALQAFKNRMPKCPYQTGYAVAVICENSSLTAAEPDCQLRLEEKMKLQGFCRSYYEPWLYEFKGHGTLPSTIACDWVPGKMLRTPIEDCPENQTTPTTYATGKSSTCATNYYSACTQGLIRKATINLAKGTCNG